MATAALLLCAACACSSAPMMVAAAAAAGLPLPTPQQLAWQKGEIMALVHFNMATFFKNGDPGCDASNWKESQKPSSFAPSSLDTDNWAAAMAHLGVHEAVLTAKHGCGFAIWPTQAKLPNGTAYSYHSDVDVLGQFSASMAKAGIGHGFYYSLTNNFFLNVGGHVAHGTHGALPGQVPVTQAEFEAIAVQQVGELWANYGNLTEM
jgi:alpha-L-fucosidase